MLFRSLDICHREDIICHDSDFIRCRIFYIRPSSFVLYLPLIGKPLCNGCTSSVNTVNLGYELALTGITFFARNDKVIFISCRYRNVIFRASRFLDRNGVGCGYIVRCPPAIGKPTDYLYDNLITFKRRNKILHDGNSVVVSLCI